VTDSVTDTNGAKLVQTNGPAGDNRPRLHPPQQTGRTQPIMIYTISTSERPRARSPVEGNRATPFACPGVWPAPHFQGGGV